ncbi:MAG: hypothetical protein R6X09_04945 [Bacteroidales bacterium]
MKRLFIVFAVLVEVLTSCEKEDGLKTIVQGDYPVKEYYLERNPNTNPWGAAMDFIHHECTLTETDLDLLYLSPDTTNPYDIKLYTVKAYFTDENGDTQSEGCPAMLLGTGVSACKVGAGIAFFDSLTLVSADMLVQLTTEPEVDYEACKNSSGNYVRELLYAAIDQCVIGRSFRTRVLDIPGDMTEQEVQPVFLVKTAEGGYVKFMVKQFQGDPPREKQLLVRWQVIRE